MADPIPPVKPSTATPSFESDRLAVVLNLLEQMAAGQLDLRLPISPRHDELDAIAHGINVLVGELSLAGDRAKAVQEQRAAELSAADADARTRSDAILRAIPDLMFILQRDGTYVDYHVRDPALLFVPPSAFIGRTVRETLPPALAERMMAALERASQINDPVIVEYGLPMDEPRFYEARIVRADADRLLSIVRDVTEAKRAAELIRNLARRLMDNQEIERHRIARELHDDVSQRMAVLNIEIDRIAAQIPPGEPRTRLRGLSGQVKEMAAAIHNLSYELHPSRLHTLGLVAALESLCHDVSTQFDLRVAFTHGHMPPSVDGNVSLCLYRITQEALRNVAEHSQAREARVSISRDGEHIELQIADAGVGFDPMRVRHGGLGLVSMRERAAASRGHLSVHAVPGGGTRITVRLPVSEAPDSARPSLAPG